jgi:hypothetical protein
MKPDIYTKGVLTAIVILLAVIAAKPIFQPDATVSAQSPFSGIQFSYFDSRGEEYWRFFDTRTGELWVYGYANLKPLSMYRLRKLGEPLELVK